MTTTQRRERAAWGSLSRAQVVDAAERRVRAGSFESLSMRSLAADLGVAPMSLYGHIRDKDDLLDEVVDRLLASTWEPAVDRSDWGAWVEEAAERLRALLVGEPVALHVFLSHPVVSPAAMARMEAMLEVFQSAGFSNQAAERAYAAVHTYTIGFAAFEAARTNRYSATDEQDPLRQRLARFTTPEQFREGLTYFLGGLEQQRR